MTNNEKELIGIIDTLCDAVGDSLCGCDACPYAETINDEQCEAYDIIARIKAKSANKNQEDKNESKRI